MHTCSLQLQIYIAYGLVRVVRYRYIYFASILIKWIVFWDNNKLINTYDIIRFYCLLYLLAQSISGRLPKRGRSRGERIDESKNVQTTPTRTYCKRNRPLPYCNQNCRTPRHWKVTQHRRTTRPLPTGHGPICIVALSIPFLGCIRGASLKTIFLIT